MKSVQGKRGLSPIVIGSRSGFLTMIRGFIRDNCSLTAMVVPIFVQFGWLIMVLPAQAASFVCTKAQSNVEHLICDNPLLSKLDSTLGQDYQNVLSKASDEQKQYVIAEQRHWLKFTRDVCETVTCLKHAYWSRQAALETYFEPRSPLYEKESDKAEAIKQVLATSPLYYRAGTDRELNQFCTQIFGDLKEIKGIHFINPVVQTQSYEDPALDPWKQHCRKAPPFHYSYSCSRNIVPANADDEVEACRASYGLPPFKIYELPPEGNSGEKRYIFYNDESYGPMNWDHLKPNVGGGSAGFRQIHVTQCLSVRGNYWVKGDKEQSSWKGLHGDASQGGRNGKNFNSIIEYGNQYYFVILHQHFGSPPYSLDVLPADSRNLVCRWSSVKN